MPNHNKTEYRVKPGHDKPQGTPRFKIGDIVDTEDGPRARIIKVEWISPKRQLREGGGTVHDSKTDEIVGFWWYKYKLGDGSCGGDHEETIALSKIVIEVQLTQRQIGLLKHAIDACISEFSYDDIQREYGIKSSEYRALKKLFFNTVK